MLSEYGSGDGQGGVAVVAAFGPIEMEYAAIRRSCVLMDLPHRGVVEVTGPDTASFLNRMITQELKTQKIGEGRRAFWLNRKGRIDADLRVWRFEDRTLLDVDVHATGRTVEGLSSYIVADDLAIREISAATHRLALHGPSAAGVMAAVVEDPGEAKRVEELENGSCVIVEVKGQKVVVAREDQTGEIGLELMCLSDAARGLYERILGEGGWLATEAGTATNGTTGGAERAAARVRPGGWHAFNIARIEAGTAIYNLDFGPDSLPAETGVFDDRVSLTKGCYLGQEIVARMHARGHPKRRLVGIKLEREIPLGGPGESASAAPRQPETGSNVFAPAKGGEAGGVADPMAIGAVTSSACSPMLGQTPVCFAMMKYELAVAGTAVEVEAEGKNVRGVIQEGLRFYSKG